MPVGEGVWQGRTRSIYSMKQVWSADEALMYLHFGGPLILDGETYQVLRRWGPPRMGGWHMTKPDVMVYVEGDAIKEWNARTNESSTVLTLPGYKNLWFWHAEEQMSADGTRMGIGAVRESDEEPVGLAVDLVNRERFKVEIPFLDHGFTGGRRGRSAQRAIMSPSGKFLCILGWTHQDPGGKFHGPVRGVGESIRVFDLEGHLISEDYTVLHCPGHGDMAMGVHGEDLKIGRCNHHDDHRQQMVAYFCSNGDKRALGGLASSHNSGRCHKRPG